MMATFQIWGITAYIITLLIIIRPLGVTVTLKERSIQVWYAPSCGTTFNNWLLMHVISFLTLSFDFSTSCAHIFLFLSWSCSCTVSAYSDSLVLFGASSYPYSNVGQVAPYCEYLTSFSLHTFFSSAFSLFP